MDTSHDPDESDSRVNARSHDNSSQEEHAIDKDPSPISFQQRKWNRLRNQYNDQYLDLFKTAFDPIDDSRSNGNLPPTQLGAVTWHPEEKAKLYQALCRRGRHDLPALADLISSKSVIEIKAYLDNLREQETDRQRFEAQPKNISQAEIPAAVEIGPECEKVLDRAADALLAFQEQYDHVAGQQRSDLWLINQEVASELDEKAGDGDIDAEVEDPKFDEQVTPISERAIGLFRLTALLELSERLFMNKSRDNPNSWHNIAEVGERPSLTLETVSDLFDLVVNFLRRLVQSCLFITQSRIRASTSRDYRPSGTVKEEDVVACLNVLGVKSNTASYWVELARRNDLQVVDDAHRRGVDTNAVLAYDAVEASLSWSGRSRSVSTAPTAAHKGHSSGSIGSEEDSSDDSEEVDNVEEPGDEILSHEEGDQDLTHDSQTEGDATSPDRQSKVHLSEREKLGILEIAQEEYLERMDQSARRQEEARLLSFLGAEDMEKIKKEDVEGLGVRPKELRKSIEDCAGLDIDYEADWESRAKRQKLDPAA
ncbi:hypothetical protein H2200_007078 [Cladophialophora chaetospira]|uniref:Uncharacterized protein n=1 Tax=Cladophialophora chaetospira TaxID=386627 RepID=A0AA38X752_9EURO|nr:hypothetical protein H2200_007078 [Cladophialophora chaetospira]